MQLLSDIKRDGPQRKSEPGSCEWWYFDGISDDGQYQVIILFYDGYPFMAGDFGSPDPVIGIAVYERGKPIFDSLSRYPAGRCSFNDEGPAVTIGDNSFRYAEREKHGVQEYSGIDIRINERLPNGVELKGIFTYIGMNTRETLFAGSKKADNGSGIWNLAMPRGTIQCRMNFIRDRQIKKELKIEGTGYHDHKMVFGPYGELYRDGYRGRAHFPQATLVYEVMNRTDGEQDVRAWLISPDNRRLLYTLGTVSLESRRSTMYLLRPARRLVFRDGEVEVSVLHHEVIDSGPFSCRYISSAGLVHPSLGSETVQGVSEYIRPKRIGRRLFRNWLNRRLRDAEG